MKLNRYDTIIFVCSGNIIRSAFAQIWACHNISSNILFTSIGTLYDNSELHPKTRLKLEELGVKGNCVNSFISTHITKMNSIPSNSLFICMTKDHINDLKMNFGSSINVMLFSNLLNTDSDVDDPYFTNNFNEVYEYLIEGLLELKYKLEENK